MTTTITLDTSAQPAPAYVLEVAQALAESVRVLAHLARHREALGEPPDADRLLREISSAAERLPQVLAQLSRWAALEHAASRVEITHGKYEGRPDAAVTAIWEHLDEATAAFNRAAEETGAAAGITSAMAPGGGGDG